MKEIKEIQVEISDIKIHTTIYSYIIQKTNFTNHINFRNVGVFSQSLKLWKRHETGNIIKEQTTRKGRETENKITNTCGDETPLNMRNYTTLKKVASQL